MEVVHLGFLRGGKLCLWPFSILQPFTDLGSHDPSLRADLVSCILVCPDAGMTVIVNALNSYHMHRY